MYGNALTTQLPPPPAVSSATAIEQSRAVAETQAAIISARKFPRDENSAYLRIIKSCKRLSFAEKAGYSYKRGSEIVSGSNIKMAEMMAANWGNLSYGFRELSRSGDSSEVEAFCWDLETNVRAVRVFNVKFIRDKKTGNVAVTSERDKYELVANMAQRRVRACIFEIIPSDIREEAELQCSETIKQGDGSKTIEQRLKDMVVAFDGLGITLDMIEGFLQHKITAVDPNEFVKLKNIYRSIRDGVSTREDFFSIKPMSTDNIGSDMGMYQSATPAIDVVSEPAVESETHTEVDIDSHNKALIRLDELTSANQEVVKQYMSGRNPDTMTAGELWDVVMAVEGAM